MITSPIRIALALLALSLAPVLAAAKAVPEGKAALVEAVLGRVQLKMGEKSSTPKVGQALDFGATLATGANGRVSLRHAGNSVSRLAPNTELTLRAPEAKQKGTFLSLSKGIVRFLVGKRAPGESFEVSTSNAVAAVKGTDGEVETDGSNTLSRVFSSGQSRALEMINALSGKSIFLSAGQSAGLGTGGFERRELKREDFENSDQQFEGLPTPELDEDRAEGPGEGRNEAVVQEAVNFGELISDAIAGAMDDLGLDSILERNERASDLVAGRIAIDRNGHRTQISSYAVAQGDTLVKATFSKREEGPFKGISFAKEATRWNQTLPADWAGLLRQNLDDPANLNQDGYPNYFKKRQDFFAGNPQGDLIEVVRDYQDPLYYSVYDGQSGYNMRGDIVGIQGFSQGLRINNNPVLYFDWLLESIDPQYTFGGDTMLVYSGTPYSYDTWESSWNNNDDGTSLTFSYSIFYDAAFLKTDIRVLNSEGVAQYLPGLVQEPSFLRDFRGINNDLNIELTFRSGLLSAPIDLLIIPEFFDMMDFFDVPETYGGGGV